MKLRRRSPQPETYGELKKLVETQKQQLAAARSVIRAIWYETPTPFADDFSKGRNNAATTIQEAIDNVIMRRARMTNVTTRRDGGSTYPGGDAR